MEHERTALDVFVLCLAIRLVAAAGNLPAVFERHREAELLGLRGVNVKELHSLPDDLARLAVFDLDEEKALVNEFPLFLGQQHFRHLVKDPDDLLVRIQPRLTLIFSARHVLADHALHPDDAEQVVDVLVGDDDVAHILPFIVRVLKPS